MPPAAISPSLRLPAAAPDAERGAARALAGHPDLAVTALALPGPAATVLAGRSSDAELLVVGHRGHGGFAGLRLGSVALRTVARAGCPAIVVRGDGHRARGTVLAAVDVGDGTACADAILAFAFAEAAQRGSRLKVISAFEVLWPYAYTGDTGQLGRASIQAAERAGAVLGELVRPWQAKYLDVLAEHELSEGAPSMVLTEVTTYTDLVVVGAHRHGGGRQGVRVGPIAHTLLMHSDCSVAVVPHD